MDERFPVNSDPRFSRPKKRGRVVLDSRFSSVLDPNFSDEPKFDRYGRPFRSRKKDLDAMKALYILSEDISKDSSFSGKKNTSLKKNDVMEEGYEKNIESLSEESVEQSVSLKDDSISPEEDALSSDEQSSDLPSDDLELVDPDPNPVVEIPKGKMTYRLAAVNLDWDHIRSVDLFAVLNSFVPRKGRILSVRIYPSDFGKKRMEKEDAEGPPRDIFSEKSCKKKLDKNFEKKQFSSTDQGNFSDKLRSLSDLIGSLEFTEYGTSLHYKNRDHLNGSDHLEELNNNKSGEDSDIDSDKDSYSDDMYDEEEIKQNLLKEDDGKDFNMSQLRKYQLERLRYYYAIIVCDSVDTAGYIYKQCDGREYEASANFFDLRFVPDEESFDSMEFRDECLSLPENYVPDEFVTDALKHSKVKLMWDNDDPVYVQMVKRAFSGKEINENDFKAYLASTDSEASDIEETKKKYRSLLLETENEFLSNKNVVGDLQVTFMPGLDHKESKETSNDHETTLEKYKRKEKERKQKKKEKKLSKAKESSGEADSRKDNLDLGFNDPFFSEKPSISSKKTKRKTVEKKEKLDDKKKAELELLMMEDESLGSKKIDHFDMKEILKMEKKKKKHIDTEGLQDDFEMDVNDPRFSAIYSSHHFAIDPTNPHFKKTKSMMKILEERRRRIDTS
ncbi:hypothetical protein PORY_001059 [Pneumocystis oryctolagi]|uniref:Uncharacterized protein n=1 Tax=Pneumocystis oryctolagi TaxID=42067 RepID=A0ACB7CD50_9ASCO|nr:hypothetical protein PORY_001059 [Pneumocystis oryctolagi]